MKKIFLFTLVVFLHTCLLSQTSFITRIYSEYIVPRAIEQLQSDNYLVFTTNTSKATIVYKIGKTGNILDTTQLSYSVGYIIDTETDSNKIMAFGVNWLDDTIQTNIIEFDTNLNVIQSSSFLTQGSSFMWWGIRHKDRVSIAYMDGDVKFIKILSSEIDTLIFYNNTNYTDIRILNKDYLYLLNWNKLVKVQIKDFIKVDSIYTSSNYNDKLPKEGGCANNIQIINDKIYYRALLDSNTKENNNNYVAKYDTNLNFINNKYIYAQGLEREAQITGFDSYSDNIFIANSTGYYTDGFHFTKLDTNLNIIFQKFFEFKDTSEFAYIFEVYATHDGGAIVTTGANNRLIIYKLDADGNLPLSFEEDTEIKVSNYLVYPNPALDFIKIKKAIQVNEAEFILYNSLGQIVLQKTLSESTTEINISALSKGVYVYNIFVDGKLDDEGKVVVE